MLRASSRTKSAPWTRFSSTFRSSSSFQSARSTSSPPSRDRRQPPPRGLYTVSIRTWDRLRSPLDSLAIIQYLEQSFGRVQEFRNHKNGAFLTDTLYVRFQDAESAKRALGHTTVVTIPSPPATRHEGGVGLADCEAVLEKQQVDHDVAENNSGSVGAENLMFRIRPAQELLTFRPLSEPRAFLSRKSQVAFAQWSGFAPIAPVLKGTSLEGMDHPRMRTIVRRFEQRTNAPNPLEYSPKETNQPTSGSQLTDQDLVEAESTAPISQPLFATPAEAIPEDKHEDIQELSPLQEGPSTSVETHLDSVVTKPTVEASEPPSAPVNTVTESDAQSTDTQSTIIQSSTINTPPPPSPQESAARKALETEQVQQATLLLQKLQNKPKRNVPTNSKLPKSTKPPKSSQPFLEAQNPEEVDVSSESSEATQSHPEPPSNTEQKTESGDEKSGRLRKFIGGWF